MSMNSTRASLFEREFGQASVHQQRARTAIIEERVFFEAA